MMLKAITVERYRCFVAPATLELRPLTLLFGKNSAGKSAFLRALPLLSASCRRSDENRTGPLALEHPSAMGARYEDLRTRLVATNDLGLKLAWDDPDPRVGEIEIRLRDMTDLGPERQVVSRVIVRDSIGEEVLRADLDLETDRLVLPQGLPVATEAQGLALLANASLPHPARGIMERCEELLKGVSSAVDWLGPVRVPPPRRTPRLAKAKLGSLGESLTEVLAQPENSELLRGVSTGVAAIFGSTLELAEEAGEVSLVVRSGVRQEHVLDVGGGVGQVLPALVRLVEVELGRSKGRIVALEQPEAHLHPAAEVELAKIIVGAIAAQRGSPVRPRVVVETHSENLLLSLQLAVLQQRLAPEDIVLYWFDRLDNGSVVPTAIQIDKLGRPYPPFPPGVFSEDLEIARQVLRERARRRT
jgi:hypothetical protein